MWERPRSLGHAGPSHISQIKTPSTLTSKVLGFELTKLNQPASLLLFLARLTQPFPPVTGSALGMHHCHDPHVLGLVHVDHRVGKTAR